ncbi:hypothetical protein K9M42_03020 [Patescibacteria group bacterium]|nr:hypothetical protein [Patescibacteria group bacterium]
MKIKNLEGFVIDFLIASLFISFIVMTSISFIKNNPDKANNIIQAISWYIKELLSPIL